MHKLAKVADLYTFSGLLAAPLADWYSKSVYRFFTFPDLYTLSEIFVSLRASRAAQSVLKVSLSQHLYTFWGFSASPGMLEQL